LPAAQGGCRVRATHCRRPSDRAGR
jgi:hypothetical protein